MFFLRPVYFLNADDMTKLKASTTMTDDEIALFFSPTDPLSFQAAFVS